MGRLKLAQSELKANKEWKAVGDAAKPFEVGGGGPAEMMSIFKRYPDAKRGRWRWPIKKKTEKICACSAALRMQQRSTGCLQEELDVDAKIGGCASANASSGYAAQRVKSATASKIN